MEAEKKKRRRWRDIPLATKMILAVGSIMIMMLVINMILYEQVNKTIKRMDTVYSSNVDLTDLSASLENVQQALYSYLSVKTSDSLENYYRCEQDPCHQNDPGGGKYYDYDACDQYDTLRASK